MFVPTPLGPAAPVFAQEAENCTPPRPVFAPFRRRSLTPACQGRAGAFLKSARSASIRQAHRALVLALTAGVDWPLLEEGDPQFSSESASSPGGPRNSGRSSNPSSIVARPRWHPPL